MNLLRPTDDEGDLESVLVAGPFACRKLRPLFACCNDDRVFLKIVLTEQLERLADFIIEGCDFTAISCIRCPSFRRVNEPFRQLQLFSVVVTGTLCPGCMWMIRSDHQTEWLVSLASDEFSQQLRGEKLKWKRLGGAKVPFANKTYSVTKFL